jgi:S1-C subfamily serine protease
MAVLAFCMAWVQPSAAQQSTVQTVANAKAAVVYVVSSTNSGAMSGSGFVIRSNSASSTIVTANHVVEGANQVDVIFDSDLHKRYSATVVSRDHVKDVAILSVAIGNRSVLNLEPSSKFNEGTQILVIGYPRATLQFRKIEGDDLRPSVHSGIISAIRLNGELIQFDAAIDHGDSGGPIIDASTGKVVAIVRGVPLDPAYIAHGMEQALPGSGFGPSADTIAGVLIANSPPDNKSTASSANDARPAPQANSASYRLGYGVPRMTVTGNQGLADGINSGVDASVLSRLVNFLKGDNSLYLVPLNLSPDLFSNSERLAGYCADNRLNAFAIPQYSWNLTGGPRTNNYGAVVGYSGNASVTMNLYIVDCFGQPFFVGSKNKSENRTFAHRTPDREIVDMANDLLDQLMSQFAQTQTSRSTAWDTLLKFGVAFDPNDPGLHSLFYFDKKPEGLVVRAVVTGGPAAVAGIRPLDRILQVGDADTSSMSLEDFRDRISHSDFALTIQRPGGTQVVQVHPIPYADAIRVVQH